jgi:hypothetical protein
MSHRFPASMDCRRRSNSSSDGAMYLSERDMNQPISEKDGSSGSLAAAEFWANDFHHFPVMENDHVLIRFRVCDAFRWTMAISLHFANGPFKEM